PAELLQGSGSWREGTRGRDPDGPAGCSRYLNPRLLVGDVDRQAVVHEPVKGGSTGHSAPGVSLDEIAQQLLVLVPADAQHGRGVPFVAQEPGLGGDHGLDRV